MSVMDMPSQQPPTHVGDSVDSIVPGTSDSSIIFEEPEEVLEGHFHDLTTQTTQAGSFSHDNDLQSIRQQIASAMSSSFLRDEDTVATAHTAKTADTAIRTDAASASAQASTVVPTNTTRRGRKGRLIELKAVPETLGQRPATYIDHVAAQRYPRPKN